jgi:serine protease AprX
MKIKSLPIFLLLPFLIFSQTAAERIKIASFSNKEGNIQLENELRSDDILRKSRLIKYLNTNPYIAKIISEKGVKTELIDVLANGEKIYAKTLNFGAATTARATSLYNGGSLGVNIQGQNMLVGVWDAGIVLPTHNEFMVEGKSKISVKDIADLDDHATHVAGTIAAQGFRQLPSVRGVAFNASVNSYDWNSDLIEMQSEAQSGLLVSNHSYAFGPLDQIWLFGAYDIRAQKIDEICFNNPYYLPVIAAGNARGNTSGPALPQMVAKSGYDLLFGHSNAKNAISVAAVEEVSQYTYPSNVVMSSFSSWGPSDDGRIKPEISTKGVDVLSTISPANFAIEYKSGTSMAAPGVAGVATLLQQYHNQLYGNYMKAATVKGLMLHAADEAGSYLGPDYQFGWGLINAENAAKIIRDKNLSTKRSLLEENVLLNSDIYTKKVSASGSATLRISISWTDKNAPTFNEGEEDPATKYLVNDLDIKVVSSSGTIYYPWKLGGMTKTGEKASHNSTNDVDNFERVDIESPSGTYTITVSHKGTLIGGNQNFTIIASSGNLNVLATEGSVDLENEISVYPNPADRELVIKNNNLVEANVTIIDQSARIISEQVIKNGKVNIENLSPGNYILIYSDKNNRKASLKFIKK